MNSRDAFLQRAQAPLEPLAEDELPPFFIEAQYRTLIGQLVPEQRAQVSVGKVGDRFVIQKENPRLTIRLWYRRNGKSWRLDRPNHLSVISADGEEISDAGEWSIRGSRFLHPVLGLNGSPNPPGGPFNIHPSPGRVRLKSDFRQQ